MHASVRPRWHPVSAMLISRNSRRSITIRSFSGSCSKAARRALHSSLRLTYSSGTLCICNRHQGFDFVKPDCYSQGLAYLVA